MLLSECRDLYIRDNRPLIFCVIIKVQAKESFMYMLNLEIGKTKIYDTLVTKT